MELPVPKTLHVSLLIFISMLSSVEHCFVMLAVYRHRELRSITYLIIFNLSVADILFGGIILPLEVCRVFSSCAETCYFRGVVSTLLIFTSENITAFVSVERFVAINFPFKHRQWFDTRLIVFCITFIWLLSGIITFFPVFTSGYVHIEKFYHCGIDWWNDKLTTVIIITFQNVFIFVILVYCNINILQTVRKRPSLGSTTDASEHMRVQMERRISALVATVIVTYLICFTPYCSILYCFLITDQCKFSHEFLWLALLLIRINCCVNPVIYALMNRRFRKAFKEMLCIKN